MTGLSRLQPTARPGRTEPGFRIKDIRRTTVALPYRPVPARNMVRELPHWVYSEICEVELANGTVGFGETMLYYTWGATSDEDVNFANGKNAATIMWNDELGAGLQMACFDAVARAMDVPIHALLGKQAHTRTPVAWWDIDLPPEECHNSGDCWPAHKFIKKPGKIILNIGKPFYVEDSRKSASDVREWVEKKLNS